MPPKTPDPPTVARPAAPLAAADDAADAAEEATPPAAVVVAAAVAPEEADLEELSESSELADETADETIDDRALDSTAEEVVPAGFSHLISVGTMTPALLQMLPAKSMAACWSVALHSSLKQHEIFSIKAPLPQMHPMSTGLHPAIPSGEANGSRHFC